MLKINQELLAIDDAIDQVVKKLMERPETKRYQALKTQFDQDAHLSQLRSEFLALKEDYERVEAYTSYRPEIAQMKRALLQKKRELDLDEITQQLRQSEHDLQSLLARVTQDISQAIDQDIFVDTGLPFAPSKRPHGHQPGQNIRERMED